MSVYDLMQSNVGASTSGAVSSRRRYARPLNMNNASVATLVAYDRRTIVLHWLTATLVLALWIVGQTIDFFPKGAPGVTVRSLHIMAGALLALVVAWRGESCGGGAAARICRWPIPVSPARQPSSSTAFSTAW